MDNANYWTRIDQQRFGRRRLLRAGVLLGGSLAGAALIGCSGSGGGGNAPAAGGNTADKPLSSTSNAAEGKRPEKPAEVPWVTDLRDGKKEPKYGGTLTTNMSYGLPSVDPLKNQTADTLFFHGLHGTKLLEHSGLPGVTSFEEPIIADLAQKWEQVDPLTFVFTLNPKAVWQDRAPANGRQMVAEDVKFTYERYMGGGVTKARFEPVAKVEAVDKTTVKITLKRRTPEILDTFAFEHHAILNPEYVASKNNDLGNGGTNYVGSGPFIQTEYQQLSKSVWVRNPNYWAVDPQGRKLPYLDKLNYVTIPDPAAQRAAFDSGQLDHVALDTEFFEQYAKRPDVVLGKATNGANMLSLTATHKKAPFGDVRVRKAISMSIDRKMASDQFYAGMATPVVPFPPKAFGKKDLPGWGELHANYQRNLAEAKKLLAAAGFANGVDLGPLSYPEGAVATENATLFYAQQLKEAGISVKPVKIDRNTYLERRNAGMWDGMMNITQPNPGVADQVWAEIIHSNVPNNYWGINEPEVDKIIEKLRDIIEPNERKGLFEQLLKLEQENVYRMYTIQTASLNAFKSHYQNPSVNLTSLLEYKEFMRKYAWLNK